MEIFSKVYACESEFVGIWVHVCILLFMWVCECVCMCICFCCEHVSVCLKVGMCECAYTHVLSMCIHAYVCMNRDKCRGVSVGVHQYMYCAWCVSVWTGAGGEGMFMCMCACGLLTDSSYPPLFCLLAACLSSPFDILQRPAPRLHRESNQASHLYPACHPWGWRADGGEGCQPCSSMLRPPLKQRKTWPAGGPAPGFHRTPNYWHILRGLWKRHWLLWGRYSTGAIPFPTKRTFHILSTFFNVIIPSPHTQLGGLKHKIQSAPHTWDRHYNWHHNK